MGNLRRRTISTGLTQLALDALPLHCWPLNHTCYVNLVEIFHTSQIVIYWQYMKITHNLLRTRVGNHSCQWYEDKQISVSWYQNIVFPYAVLYSHNRNILQLCANSTLQSLIRLFLSPAFSLLILIMDLDISNVCWTPKILSQSHRSKG